MNVPGVQRFAPYLFEIYGAAFLSDRGDLSLRWFAGYGSIRNQPLYASAASHRAGSNASNLASCA